MGVYKTCTLFIYNTLMCILMKPLENRYHAYFIKSSRSVISYERGDFKCLKCSKSTTYKIFKKNSIKMNGYDFR